MKNEAGLRPMKRGFATRKGNFALRFMATELPFHRSRKASDSYSRSEYSFDFKKNENILTKEKGCDILLHVEDCERLMFLAGIPMYSAWNE